MFSCFFIKDAKSYNNYKREGEDKKDDFVFA